MADDAKGIAPGLVELGKTFGLGGVLLALGVVLWGLAIYKAGDFKDYTQTGVLIGGFLCGAVSIALGVIMIRTGNAVSTGARTLKDGAHDVFIAAPMAGFGTDEAGRAKAVELVQLLESALRRLPEVRDVYTPVLSRPDPGQYESPDNAFEKEFEALRASKRYLLVLPDAIPSGSSVLVTAGIAMALRIPSVILTPGDKEAPYLLEGAIASKTVSVRRETYDSHSYKKSIDRLIANNGLKLFGG